MEPLTKDRFCNAYFLLFMSMLIGMMITGCATLPKDTRVAAPLETPQIKETLHAQFDNSSEKIVKKWPSLRWWEEFHNPEMNRIITIALGKNPDLKASLSRIHQAWAIAAGARSRYLPSFSSTQFLFPVPLGVLQLPGSSFFGPFGDNSFFFWSVIPALSNYHLDLWGEDKARVRAAIGMARASEAEYALARLFLSTTLASRYIRLASAEEELGLARSGQKIINELLHLVQMRKKSGIENLLPVHTIEQRLETINQLVNSLERETKILRDEIARLAGQSPDWGRTILVKESTFPKRFPLPKSLPLDLLGRRPDVAVSQWRAEALAHQVKVTKTAFYPNLDLVALVGFETLNFATLFLNPALPLLYIAGPAWNLPIFTAGRLSSELVVAQEEYNIAVESYNSTLLSAFQQVADALAVWKETDKNLSSQEQSTNSAQSNAELSARLFSAGINTKTDLLDLQYTLIQSQITLSNRTAEHLEAAVGLFLALGGGYESIE